MAFVFRADWNLFILLLRSLSVKQELPFTLTSRPLELPVSDLNTLNEQAVEYYCIVTQPQHHPQAQRCL